MEREDELTPADVRRAVIERDGQCCRICGRWVEWPALHHVIYRSHGGLDVVENLVVVGWYLDHDCHLKVCHGRDARQWRDLLQQAIVTPGVSAVALRRWADPASPPVARSGLSRSSPSPRSPGSRTPGPS